LRNGSRRFYTAGPLVLVSAESGTELAQLVDGSGALGFVSKTELSGDTIRNLLAHADSGGSRTCMHLQHERRQKSSS
jgi:hypothetical protein